MYICDYRLDKSAHLFYKIHRNRYPVCTKSYAFDHFPKRLTPKRDFSVRGSCDPGRVCMPEGPLRGTERRKQNCREPAPQPQRDPALSWGQRGG